jgi:hypothetical protein
MPIAGIVLVCVLGFSGCASGSRKVATRTPVQTTVKPFEQIQIQDYQTRAEGENIPEWVNRYLSEGVRGVEEIPEFRNKYVFVSLSEGSNFKALSQWEEAFSPTQDFARLVASRIEARLNAVTQVTFPPDDTLGRFFETLIKKASDAQYLGAVKETGFWFQQFFSVNGENPEGDSLEVPEDGAEVKREVYDFLILTSIDKNRLESQIDEIFNAAKAIVSPKRDLSALNRIRENFFEGF